MKTYSRKNSSYLKKAFIASNFDEMCRLCLSEVDKVLTPIIQDSKSSYQEWINYGVDVLVEEGDGLPPNICEECLVMVEQTYLFKKKCKASDAKLRKHFELLEQTEEEKLHEIRFSDESDQQNSDVMNESVEESICDKSNAVDSGGTEDIQSRELEVNYFVVENDENSFIISNEGEEAKKEVSEKEKSKKKLVVNRIERYVLKGKKQDGDQEEDFTACEVVPIDVKTQDDSAVTEESLEISNCLDLAGHFMLNESSKTLTTNEKLEKRIQEIYQLWDNEEEKEEEEKEKNEHLIFSVVWGNPKSDDSSILSETEKIKSGEVELRMQENENFTTHKIYTNVHEAEIIEAIPETRKFQCTSCAKNFSEKKEFRDHLFQVHKEFSDNAFCDICCKMFTCHTSLKRHLAVHTGIKPFKCKTCGRKFSQNSILKRHILTHQNLKPFNCHLCHKGYTQKMNLMIHLKTHGFNLSTSENFNCKYCNKSFVHRSGLSRHHKMHKGVKFLCVFCSRSFSDPSALARHINTLHPKK